ncbi:MAG: YIP1 family protein [Desulfovibrio sp.]|jgi:hypothetical protein|nr:YIP1 family protein [Desulfovibrio sp.]
MEKLSRTATVLATCPRCSCRFRFSAIEGVLETVEPGTSRRSDAPDKEHGGDGDRPPIRRSPAPDPKDDRQEEKPGDDQEAEEREPKPARKTRAAANRAYVREAARSSGEDRVPSNPWDIAPVEVGWWTAFVQTVIRVMFFGSRFFAGLVPQQRQTRALVFYAVICTIQILVERFWGDVLLSFMSESASADPQLEKLLGLLAPQTNIPLTVLVRLAFFVMQLYIFAFAMHIVFRYVAPKRADFSLVFQVLAYSSAPALLCIVPMLGSLAGLIWSIVCAASGCRIALKLNWPQTLMGFVPIAVLVWLALSQMVAILRTLVAA